MTLHTPKCRFILSVLLALSTLWGLTCCSGDTSRRKKHVLVMWATDETDPAYASWTRMMAEEFERQGIEAELHPYYGMLGYTYENEQKRLIARRVHELDEQGKRPDLIMAHGDYPMWLLILTPDSLLTTIPMVCYGLRDSAFMERQYAILERLDLPRKQIVEIHDTLMLQEALDFSAFLEDFFPFCNPRQKEPSHRFATLLDTKAVWMDSILAGDIVKQMHRLDTARYLNCMEHYVPDSLCLRKNREGAKSICAQSFKDPGINIPVDWHPLKWIFYRQKSYLRFLQTKHDEVSRSLTEGPNLGAYYTTIAQDFLINDSCIGGYFTSADILLREAVTAGRRLLEGEKADSIGRLLHTPARHVNWNLMRPLGVSVEQMPEGVNLYHTTFRDYHPTLYVVFYALAIFLFVVLVVFSAYYSARSILLQYRNRQTMNEKARQAIYAEQLLELAMEANDAMMWDESQEGALLERIQVEPQWRERLQAFFGRNTEGLYQMEFRGCIDGQQAHWYELRMKVEGDGAQIRRSGIVRNIDQAKLVEEQAHEANRIMMEARTREGFIASMNHEIRTPLHAIVGFSTELARPGIILEKEELETFGGIIESNAAALTKMIDDILQVTLMKNTHVNASCRKCSVKSLLNPKKWKAVHTEIQYRHNTLGIQSGGENLWVSADPAMVATVMDNLLLNASLFSAEGSHIEVGFRALEAGGAQLWVRDEGIGIQERYFPMLFDYFFKVNSFSRGCGLGLYISRTYMEKMGGSIQVESQPSKGSTFTLTFKP